MLRTRVIAAIMHRFVTLGVHAVSIKVAKFLDVSAGLQPDQFSVGSHDSIESLNDLDPIYKQLLDEPIAVVLGLIGGDGRVNMTPMWFDYDGSQVLLNLASHRKKIDWVRNNPQLSMLLVNPKNAYHWISIKSTVVEEISEDDPEKGPGVTAQLDRIWTKYTQQPPPYGLRDPAINERRVLFIANVDRVATFGTP
jgi:general stress protein 26